MDKYPDFDKKRREQNTDIRDEIFTSSNTSRRRKECIRNQLHADESNVKVTTLRKITFQKMSSATIPKQVLKY